MRLETTTYLVDRFSTVRKQTLSLIEPLEQEDFVIQASSDVSPPKWHIAHTTWFFERMILQEYDAEYTVFHPAYNYLFNSYYNSIGPYQPRHQRGVLSRPTVREVLAYREHVDQAVRSLLQQKRDESVQHVIEQLIRANYPRTRILFDSDGTRYIVSASNSDCRLYRIGPHID